jgi:hypothetical protein
VAARLLPSVVRAFAALLLGGSPAASEFFTGNELQAFCNSPNWDEKNPSLHTMTIRGALNLRSRFEMQASGAGVP